MFTGGRSGWSLFGRYDDLIDFSDLDLSEHFVYDAQGNFAYRRSPAGEQHYEWRAFNRLTAATVNARNGLTSIRSTVLYVNIAPTARENTTMSRAESLHENELSRKR